jgi:hypothetical protein
VRRFGIAEVVPGAVRVLGEGVFGIGREGWVDVVRGCEGRAWTIGVELVVAECWRCRARGPLSFEREVCWERLRGSGGSCFGILLVMRA